MPQMRDSSATAANTTGSNVLAGRQYEFIPTARRGYRVRLHCNASATGLYLNLTIGATQITDSSGILVGVLTTAGRLITPDDFVLEHGAAPGKRVFLTFRNSTGASITAYWQIDVDPVL